MRVATASNRWHRVHAFSGVKGPRAATSQRARSGVAVNSLLGGLKGMLDRAGGSVSKEGASPVAESAMSFDDNAPSWSELEELVQTREAELGTTPMELEEGPPSPLALRRPFGSTEPIRVKLYRDHAAWCPYCQKVWLMLEIKQIPYEIEKINMRCYGDKPRSFTSKVPSGLLPVMELDGQVITESDRIMAILESEYPERPLLPRGEENRERTMTLLRLERQLFSAWMGWLTQAWGHEQNRERLQMVLAEIEVELEQVQGPFFFGKDITLADVVFAPFLERLAASLAYYKGYYVNGMGTYPNLELWYCAMEGNEAYLATRADYYSTSYDLPPQLGGCAPHPDGEAVRAQIDGNTSDAWRLPLPRLTKTSMPEPYAPGDQPELDTVIAAARLVRNHEAVARFAARGTGSEGTRPVTAPLSDPTAKPNEDAVPHVDAALRHVAHALLVGVDTKQAGDHRLQAAQDGSGCKGGLAAGSLPYLRDRVGVPRDMPFPAARQLRAHINWFLDAAEDSVS